LFVLATGPFAVLANVGNDFSSPYGLVAHSENQDLPTSRINALDALMKYFGKEVPTKDSMADLAFSDIKKSSRSYANLQKACSLKIVDCTQGEFYPFDDVASNDFLVWFFRLKYGGQPKALEAKYPTIHQESTRDWMEARRLNLVSGEFFTTKTTQDFLDRYSVSEANLGVPFTEALAIDPKQIDPNHYHNLKEIEIAMDGLRSILANFEARKGLSNPEKAFEKKIIDELGAFDTLKLSLSQDPYVLSGRTDLDPQVVQLVKHFGLQEILSSFSYDYSKNPDYRKYNLVTGLKKIQGKLLMPGEILDYWKLISDKNLWDFKYGWVIADGTEEWAFGGGICGSATMTFIPLWKAGLDVVERRSHSVFYSSLYPRDQIGLDATVYRPKPNLILQNNLGSPVVFNVINDTKKQVITVEVIGNRTYKTAKLVGPTFTDKNTVHWVRQVEGFDGTIISDTIESHYNAIF
jgi:hypothetical protein